MTEGAAPAPTEYVYLIGSESSPLVKIGRTTDLLRRLADIQNMSPVKLTVLWRTEGSAGLETALHRHFKAQRVHGEWFDFPDRDALEQVVRALPGLTVVEPKPSPPRKRQYPEGHFGWDNGWLL
jgi:Meiotically Up-regulated Gene 113 (MUG113) protein